MSEGHRPCVCAACVQRELRCQSLFFLLISVLVCLCGGLGWGLCPASQLGVGLQEEGSEHAGDTNKTTVSFSPGAQIFLNSKKNC